MTLHQRWWCLRTKQCVLASLPETYLSIKGWIHCTRLSSRRRRRLQCIGAFFYRAEASFVYFCHSQLLRTLTSARSFTWHLSGELKINCPRFCLFNTINKYVSYFPIVFFSAFEAKLEKQRKFLTRMNMRRQLKMLNQLKP